jgi:pilus assembly protein FimV
LTPAPAPPALPVQVRQATVPAVCEQQTEQARACAALDGKNAALKAQLGSLEGKVKSLQASLGAAPAAPPAPVPAAVKEPAGPKPISAIKPLVPRKPKPAAPEPGVSLPWGWIGGGVALLLALAGGLLLLRRRVRTVRNVDIPAAPRLVDRLRHSFPARTKPAAAEPREAVSESAEPSFD